jgi:putative nucleotidyltransferase with HDIG domain
VEIEGTFLRSRVARRVFALFIGCTILPITALAVISYAVVTAQLQEQSRQQLKQASKAVGMAIFERLLFLEAELKGIEARMTPTGAAPRRPPTQARDGDLGRRFTAVALVGDAGTQTPLFGRIDPPPQVGAAEREAVASGKTAIFGRFSSGQRPRLFMARGIVSGTSDQAVLLGEVNTTYLWGSADENPLPPQTEFCVLQAPNAVFACTSASPPPATIFTQATSPDPMTYTTAFQFEWTDGGEDYLASAWTLFLQSSFNAPSWIVVLSQSKTEVLSPIRGFKKVFPVVILICFCVVILLSIAQIRRSLVPLERLQEGTRRIAAQDFDSQGSVTSGDEFEDLAESFNRMARRLGRQFHALSTTAEVTQIVLSSLDTRRIAETVLLRMVDVCPCDHVGLILTGRDQLGAVLYIQNGMGSEQVREEAVPITLEDVRSFRMQPKTAMRKASELPMCLASWGRLGFKSSVILPIFLKDQLAGLVALGYLDSKAPDAEDLNQARLLADHVAAALANAGLVEELHELNWGTLHALARTIDAKSPWTAGHSERVTELALRIGRALQLDPQALDVLHRGALLHDLGKLGIPAEILDKPGNLTAQETRLTQGHVTLGGRILEPIAAYADVIPIVLQHHESFDGTGYTQGLAEEAIHFGARILAVADVADALGSDRPYRQGMDRKGVIAYIRERSGRQFDPRTVEAFLQVMAQRDPEADFGTDEGEALKKS